MAIFELYSKRQRKLKGEIPNVYSFDIPQKLRVQIIHIMNDTIGDDENFSRIAHEPRAYKFLFDTLCREYGVFDLVNDKYNNKSYKTSIQEFFFLETNSNDEALDVIELTFKYINIFIKKYNQQQYFSYADSKITPDNAIVELNQRFKENGVGYQFEGNNLIKLDSTYIHNEIVKPTIELLWNNKFKGANDEYLKAHEHYRHGRNKECLTECLKAFESTMKIILKEKGWTFNPTDTSKKLIHICFQNNLIPSFSQNQFTSLQNLLESGIPTIRNKLSGHGQGQEVQKVDDGITRYGLNLTGTNIIFLVEQSGIK